MSPLRRKFVGVVERVPLYFGVFVAVVLVAALMGAWIAMDIVNDGRFERDRRERLELACLGGNENACLMYQADFGR